MSEVESVSVFSATSAETGCHLFTSGGKPQGKQSVCTHRVPSSYFKTKAISNEKAEWKFEVNEFSCNTKDCNQTEIHLPKTATI